MSQQSFRELGASRPVVDALAARSIHQPFRIQELVLPDALAGLDVLAKSPTGSGKTLAFAVPIVERTTTDDPRPSALVLVPTRELASQVTEDIEPLARDGGRALGPPHPAEIDPHCVGPPNDRRVEPLGEHTGGPESPLVFAGTKRGADRLGQKLARHGVTAAAMHGDMSQGARERALSRFETGKVATLVATDVAARGLDLDDISHVINFDPPDEDKGYVHRTGRTGRAGRSGTAITFVLPDQQAETSRVARRLGHHEQFEQAGMLSAPAKLLYTSRRGRRSKW